jgi:cell volume regulation protein A
MNEIYIIGPLILIAVVLVAALLDRWSVPVILIALGAGIVFGSDVLNLWDFSDVALTSQIANVALIFILFQGGFSTQRKQFKSVALVAGGLATWGVILTALTTFVVLWGILRWPVEKAVLLAVIISSTDAAATFSILRRQSLPPRLSSTLEIESAANDPMAILLTTAAIQAFTVGNAEWHMVGLAFVWKFFSGIAVGWLLGHAATWLFNRLRPQDRGHYYVLLLGIVLLIYGLAELTRSSAMLAVFIAGYVMGNRPFVHKQGVANFSTAVSTVADTSMFVMMGLPAPMVQPVDRGGGVVPGADFCGPAGGGVSGHGGHADQPETSAVHRLGGPARGCSGHSGHLPHGGRHGSGAGSIQSCVLCGYSVGGDSGVHLGPGGQAAQARLLVASPAAVQP